jgi:hypothetical protein
MNERTVQRQNETVEGLSEVGWRFMDKTLPGVGCHHRCFRRCDGLHRELRSCGLKIPTRHTGEDQGTTNPLPRKAWDKDARGLSVKSVAERDSDIVKHFSGREIQYIGSTSGCGCDFPHVPLTKGEWVGYLDVVVDLNGRLANA